MNAMIKGPGSLIVPALREDLRLHLRPVEAGEEGCCLVYDPVAHRYHELNEDVFSILKNWRSGIQLEKFVAYLSEVLSTEVLLDDIKGLLLQLDHAGLLVQPLMGWRSVYHKQQKRRHGIFTWMLHNYLFIRIPLVRPDAFLERTLPIARFFCSRPIITGVIITGVLGIYMASRQWNAFWNTFLHFFSLQGAAGYLLALVFVKLLHELGHAYMAKNFGCRVPTMGIAFLVLAPVLYTDVTDAWKLKSRFERLLISAGGMIVEFGIAAIATFLWAVSPEGTLKSACFFVATTSLVISLIINISPLMRFDGYYLLSDYLRIPNLQPRAFKLMCWRLREVLFDIGAPCPEDWSISRQLGIIFYAVVVCIYRLFLFIGIAFLVYYMTTKTLGILLFIVEIIWFILRPIAKEVEMWWKIRESILKKRRVIVSASITTGFILFTMIPFPHKITLPGVVEPVYMQPILAPMSARVSEVMVKNGDIVKDGDVIVRLVSEQLQAEIDLIEIELDLARLRRDRRVGDSIDRHQTFVLTEDVVRLNNALKGLRRLESDLTIRSKKEGVIADIIPYLHKDRWVQKDQELGIVVSLQDWQIRGYIGEYLVPAVKNGALGEFIPDNLLAPKVKVKLKSIGLHAASNIDLPYLSSTYGGEIAVNEDKRKGSVPVEAQYQIILMAEDNHILPMQSIIRGVVRVEANPESLAIRTAKRALAVLIRESGF